MHMSPILLVHATLNCVAWHLFVDSWQVLQLPHLYLFLFCQKIDYCSSLLFGSTHDVTSHLQRIQNYAARLILLIPKSFYITTHLKSLHWLPVKEKSTCKIACLCYHCHSCIAPAYVADMLQKKPSHTRSTHTQCLFSIDLHTVRQHLVIARFLLLLLLSGTLFQMMSGVPHHCQHIGLVVRMSILDIEVDGANPSISMFSPWARDFIRIASVDSAVKWVPGGDNLVKGVQCYKLFGGIALKNHAFSFHFIFII